MAIAATTKAMTVTMVATMAATAMAATATATIRGCDDDREGNNWGLRQ